MTLTFPVSVHSNSESEIICLQSEYLFVNVPNLPKFVIQNPSRHVAYTTCIYIHL